MEDLDKNKVEVIIDEVFDLFIKTPPGDLVRYVFPNKKKFFWKLNYVYALRSWGMWKVQDKEIDVNGENIVLLLVDGDKVKEFKKYGFTDPKKKVLPDLFFFDDKVFRFAIAGNKMGSLDFHLARESGNNMYQLTKAFVAELGKNGVRKGNWLSVRAERKNLRKYIRKEFNMKNEDLSDYWFKSTVGNLKKKIPEQYIGYINIGNFDKKKQTYEFGLKVYS